MHMYDFGYCGSSSQHLAEEGELQTFLSDCYDTGDIDDYGLIVKSRLRTLLRNKIRRQEINLLDPEQLGPTLAKHHFLINWDDKKFFKIDTSKLPPRRGRPRESRYCGAKYFNNQKLSRAASNYHSMVSIRDATEHNFPEELELQSFLSGCLNREEITTDGLIPKPRLRMALKKKIKRNEIKFLDPEKLGPTLGKYKYLINYHDKTMFKIDTAKLPPKKEKPIPKEPIVLNLISCEYFEKLIETPGIGSIFCIFCKDFPKIKLSDHMNSKHKSCRLDALTVRNDAIIRVNHEIDTNLLWVKISLRNASGHFLSIESVYLQPSPTSDPAWKYDSVINLAPGEETNFKLERSTFKVPGSNYAFVIYAKLLSTDSMQISRLIVNRTIYDLIKEKRALKEAAAEHEWLPKPYKSKPLDDHLPDLGLLKIFTPDFKIKDKIVNLTSKEYKRYNQLVEFKKQGNVLTPLNYKEILKLLVEIEDLHVNYALYNFKIPATEVYCSDLGFSIDISEVSDFPDCISDGDFIVVKELSATGKAIGEEIVNTVTKIADGQVYFEQEDDQAPLKIAVDEKSDNIKYLVTFRKDRTCIQMEQEALSNVDEWTIKKILFPSSYNMNHSKSYNLKWFNQSIGMNNEQQQAVSNILNGSAFPAPYVIFGPPGTGKTATIVETICQIWKHKPSASILVTAPTNAACDEIASRLLKYVPPDDLYRYYSKSMQRNARDLDQELSVISNYSSRKYKPLSLKLMKKYRIILCTVVQSGRFDLAGLEKNYFDYIFLDECGSSTEPSSLIPLAGLISFRELGAKTNVVIAGDPKQLGPIITCDFANIIGLGKSLLERLMSHELYQPENGQYNEKVLTKLLQNFRSHKGLLKMPSKLFYDDQLVSKASPSVTDFALNWPLLPNSDLPLIFHGVEGTIRQESNSFSMFNEEEINLVLQYIQEIVTNGINDQKIPLSEIGVVSPYALQVQKIKNRLKRKSWNEIQVGSAERYQGKEKMVMILSTVRSNTKTAGFLGNPKRLNVVITRAKGLLIIIGNPKTLRLDSNWHQLLAYCKENGATKGEEFELKDSETDRLDVETYEEKFLKSLDDMVEKFELLLTDKYNARLNNSDIPDSLESNLIVQMQQMFGLT